jgi:hypothetical protein
MRPQAITVLSRYLRMAATELNRTHERAATFFSDQAVTLDFDRDLDFTIKFAIGKVKDSILPTLARAGAAIPKWINSYLTEACSRHPKSFSDYSVPFFYVLYKIHKLSAADIRSLRLSLAHDVDVRPITANFCWLTQPFALFVAKFLLPYVQGLPEFTKDPTAINRLLDCTRVPAGCLLISFDVSRLYPSIPLNFCIELILRFLRRKQVPATFVDLIRRCLSLVLLTNFCQFLGVIYHQILGFATGVACGAEVANIYLHELLRDIFMAAAAHIHVYRRFIDDGFIIWKGTRRDAEQFLLRLDTQFRDRNFRITWDITGDSTIFLDLKIFKGAGWLRSELLDTATYAKPINAYLYIPFSSCVPRSILSGFIATELRRHLLRCSNAVAYYEELCLFYKRLRARGYPTAFLKKQFDRHPAYSCRKHLLYRESQSPTAISGPSVLALPYADGVDSALRGLLRDHGNLLPPHIACQRRLFAWCKAPKIKDLIPVPGKNSLDANFLLDSTAAASDVPSMTHPNAAAHFFL